MGVKVRDTVQNWPGGMALTVTPVEEQVAALAVIAFQVPALYW